MNIVKFIHRMNDLYGTETAPKRFDTTQWLRPGFRGAGLVDHGPGRLGFDKGGMAKVLNYLDNLEPGTELSMNDIMKVAGENKWNVNRANLYSVLNDPEKKQIAASGNEVFVHGEDKRNLIKKINQKIKLKQKLKISPNEAIFKQIDLMIADKKKYPTLKGIGEELGYKPTKPGQGGNLRLESSLMKEYQKSRGRNLILEMRFKEYKLTKDSPWVKKAIAIRKELGSTRATAQKLGVDRKTIRNIMETFSPNEFGSINEWKSDKWNYKKERAKTEKMLEKRLGGKNSKAFKQYMNLWDDIAEMNNEILSMTDDQIYNNPRMRAAMNIDVTGLKSGDALIYDKYEEFLPDGTKNPEYLNKKQFAAKVREMANTNQFYQAEHSIPISSKKISSVYQKNLQMAQGKIGSQLEAIKTYIRNNPKGEHIPAINEFLDEFDIQIRAGGKTYGWKNPKDTGGLNVYRSDTNTSDIVESAFNKNKQGKIINQNLASYQIPKQNLTAKTLADPIAFMEKAGFNFDKCKSRGGRVNFSLAGSTNMNTCILGVLEDERKKSISGDKASIKKYSKFGKLAKNAGWLFGFADIPIELAFALPHMLRGDKEAAKRATTFGLFGWGKEKLEEVQEANPEAYKYAKHVKDNNDYIDAWFSQQDAEKADKVLENVPATAQKDKRRRNADQWWKAKEKMDSISKGYQGYFTAEGERDVWGQAKGKIALKDYLREDVKKKADIGMPIRLEPFSDVPYSWAPFKGGDPITNVEQYIEQKGEPYWKAGLEHAAYEAGVPDLYDQYFLTGDVKDPRDAYSDLPLKYASQLGKMEAEETRRQLEEIKRKEREFLEGRKFNPQEMATGGLANLTRTVAPDSGPMSQGLRSLYIDDMD
jgi:hypothetical protein